MRILEHPGSEGADIASHSFASRALDIVVASAALVLLSPLLVIAALAVRLTSSGPVIFRHERAGRDGRPFHVYKFRSMYLQRELPEEMQRELDERFKLTHDPRVTSAGPRDR